jgi:serine/threonine protein kinase
LGTKGYIAPEGPGHPAADVFSLGLVLYQAAYGMKVEQFPQIPSHLVAQMNEETFFRLNKLLLRACAPEVARRYPTAGALRADLEEFHSSLRS